MYIYIYIYIYIFISCQSCVLEVWKHSSVAVCCSVSQRFTSFYNGEVSVVKKAHYIKPKMYCKRDLYVLPKSNIFMVKDPYVNDKRTSSLWQKGPISMAEETCIYGQAVQY